MEKYQSPFGYPDEHMRLLGIIAAHWEAVELILERAIAKIMSHDPSGLALLTANINFNNKLDVLTTHVRDAFKIQTDDDKLWSEYRGVQEALKNAQKTRNDFVHSKWTISKTTGNLGRHKLQTLGGKTKILNVPVSTEELAAAARQITDASTAMIRFLERNGVDLR